MRWQVHGNDAITGQPLTLGIDEAEAVQAVHSALAKKIIVKKIAPAQPLPRLFFVATFLLILLLAAACIYFYRGQQSALAHLHDTTQQQSQLSHALTLTEDSLRTLSAHLTAPPLVSAAPRPAPSDAERLLLDQVTSSRTRIKQLEMQIAAEPAAPAVDPGITALRQQLGEAQHHAADLEAQLKTATARSDAQIERLAAQNQTLSSQVDALKSELLTAVANSTVVAAPDPAKTADPAPAAPTRWALPLRFSDAADYLNIHFDKETIGYTPASDNTVVGAGLWTANAAALRLVFDHDKERLYCATLTVSLASDAPRQKLAENNDLIATFLHTFAPTIKDPEAWVASSVQELAGKSPSQRLLLIDGENLITVWNDNPQNGTVSIKIEPSAPALTQ